MAKKKSSALPAAPVIAGADLIANMSADEFAEHMYNLPPALTEAEMHQIERIWEQDRVLRRAALHMLTQPVNEMADRMATDTEAATTLATISVRLREYSGRLKGMSELVETAALRMEVSLCNRPDMHKLLRTAKRGGQAVRT